MRIHVFLAASLALLAACSAGSAGSPPLEKSTESAPDNGGPDASGQSTGRPVDASSTTDCFGQPRNAEGRCDATLLADGLGTNHVLFRVWATAAAKGSVYVGTDDGLFRIAKPNQTEKLSADEIFEVAIAGGYLAWISTGSSVNVAKLSDATTVTAPAQLKSPRSLVSNGKYLFACDDKLTLVRLDPSAQTPATPLVSYVPEGCRAVADDDYAYYLSTSYIHGTAVSRVPVGGGTPRLLASLASDSEANGSHIAVTSTTVFFDTDAGLRSVSKTAPAAPTLLTAGRIAALTADADGSAVFWGTTEGTIARIYRADADGNNAHVLTELPLSDVALVADETALYITDRVQGSVYRLPKQ
ncbi:MAG: hypothetical protein JWO86_4166 [Myxococcaceae bacterium]|nr:hypothetical protein [Myxococcaceae bacterium]